MLIASPDLTAVMRLSTINPTGTFRKRNAISSVKVTRAPEKSARIQTLKKFRTMMKPIRTKSPNTTTAASFNTSIPGRSPPLLGRESGLDGARQFVRVRGRFRIEAFQNLAVAPDQEFVEVPFDVAG